MKKYWILLFILFLISCETPSKKVCIDELPAGEIVDVNYKYVDDSIVYTILIKTLNSLRKFDIEKDIYNYLSEGDTIVNSKKSIYTNGDMFSYIEDTIDYKEKNIDYKERINYIEK